MSDLIVFFSRSGENYVSGILKQLEVGNTEVAANILERLTGAEAFRLEMARPYSNSYNDCIAQAQADQRQNERPEIKNYPQSLDRFDTIYLGYPNYWGTMPMCVFTFLEHFDFSGKTIKPFCTHEGSGMGRSEADIKRLCPNANVKKGLAILGSNVKKSEKEIKAWLDI